MKKEKAEKLAALPMTVYPKNCGQLMEKGGGKPELQMRIGALERMKYFSPKLPEFAEAEWEYVKQKFAAKIGIDNGKNTGNAFCTLLAETKKALGKQYKGPMIDKKAGEGDPDAFFQALQVHERSSAQTCFGSRIVILATAFSGLGLGPSLASALLWLRPFSGLGPSLASASVSGPRKDPKRACCECLVVRVSVVCSW